MTRPDREVPPPLEGNDQLIAAIGAAAWAVALLVLVSLGHHLPPSRHWWIWTCVTGVGLGLFALLYIPRLKRSRARAADRRSAGNANGGRDAGGDTSDRSGSGRDSGADADSGADSRSDSGTDADSGADSRSGTDADSGADSRSGSGADSGPNA